MTTIQLTNAVISPQLLHTLLQLQQEFDPDAEPALVFGRWVQALLHLTGSTFCLVAECVVADDSSARLVRVLASSSPIRPDFPRLQHLTASITAQRGTVVRNDALDPFHQEWAMASLPPLCSSLVLPLSAGGQIIGLLLLANRPGGYAADKPFDAEALVPGCSHLLRLYQSRDQRAVSEHGAKNQDCRTVNGACGAHPAAPALTEPAERQHTTPLLGALQQYRLMKCRQEQMLACPSDELSTILEVCPDGVLAFDHRRRVIFCNSALLQLLGWERSTLVGMTQQQFEQTFNSLCPAGHPAPALPLAGDAADDQLRLNLPRPRVLSRSARSTRSFFGAGLVVYYRDVTRETEVDRMKTDFLSTAAHELRTPLASIYGFTELLLQRPFNEETRADLLQTIHRHAHTLITLINELLDIARIEARSASLLCIGAHDPLPLVQDAISQMQAQFPGRDIHLEGDGLPVQIDAAKFVQMLRNVIANGLNYSPAHSPLLVRLLRCSGAHPDALGVQVEDCGIGMTPEQVSRIFERFFRADPYGPVPGHGLGMSLVREIIDVLNGDISIQSSPGEGSRVTLWLPLAEKSS